MSSYFTNAYIVPGKPHVLLAPEASPGWNSLHQSYQKIREDIENSDAEMILVYSTQWLSVIGHLVQANKNPEWLHVDMDWHHLGEMPYRFEVDSEFAYLLRDAHRAAGFESAAVDYNGFPVDTGTIVALKHINPNNRLPVCMVSCNMYAEKNESIVLGAAAKNALENYHKKAAIVVVSSLSNRYHVKEIDPKKDAISSQKDDEWNKKVLELFSEGRLEDVGDCSRDFSKEANADMSFKAIYWLMGVIGKSNKFKGTVYDYQAIWGTGNAIIKLEPSEIDATASDSRRADFDELILPKFAQSKSEKKGLNKSANADTFAEVDSDDHLINSQKAPLPVGPYPHARREGSFLYLSGVGPRTRNSNKIPGVELDEQGEIISYDISVQTRAVIENVKLILEASGASFDDIIDVSVYLTNMKDDFKQFNKIYAEYFTHNQPTRTTVGVVALPTPIAVELKVVAKIK